VPETTAEPLGDRRPQLADLASKIAAEPLALRPINLGFERA